jgi:hypothetical protein
VLDCTASIRSITEKITASLVGIKCKTSIGKILTNYLSTVLIGAYYFVRHCKEDGTGQAMQPHGPTRSTHFFSPINGSLNFHLLLN